MKEHIDRVIKEQLGAYELPYDPGAWEAFSQKLGPAVTNTPTSTPFYRNWWFAASVVTAIVATATWMGLSTGTEMSRDSKVVANNDEPAVSGATTTNQNGPDNAVTVGQPAANEQVNEANDGLRQSAMPSAPVVDEPHTDQINTTGGISFAGPAATPKVTVDGNDETPGSNDFKQPVDNSGSMAVNALEMKKTACVGEQIEISNPNKVEALVTLPDGTQKRIAAGRKISLKVKNEGDIITSCGDLTQRIVINTPKDISIREGEPTIENGVPTVQFDVSGTQNEVTWKTESKARFTENNGRTLIVHPYNEKEVVVTVVSTDNNGCSVSSKATVNTEKTANLAAMNAFSPNGNVSQNAGFMPYLLTQRDTPFKLTIMDPTRGMQVIFETTDPSDKWTGIDSRTGQMAKSGIAYSWRVEMKNPLPKEPQVYMGFVTLNF